MLTGIPPRVIPWDQVEALEHEHWRWTEIMWRAIVLCLLAFAVLYAMIALAG